MYETALSQVMSELSTGNVKIFHPTLSSVPIHHHHFFTVSSDPLFLASVLLFGNIPSGTWLYTDKSLKYESG